LSVSEDEKSERHGKALSPATLVGLTIALLLPIPPYREPFLHLLMAGWGLSWISAWELIGLVSKLVVIITLLLLVVYWERRSLTSIGLRGLSVKDVSAAIATLLAFILINRSLIWFVDRMPVLRSELMSGVAMYASLPKWLDWSGLVANGIAEEVGFRGYAIERIEELTGSTPLGASVPFIVNVLVHAPVWGFHGMLTKAPILLLFVVLYLWRRNLPACALAHVLMDIRAFEF
jgi:membrane protease YdiL (CAAX protease family)